MIIFETSYTTINQTLLRTFGKENRLKKDKEIELLFKAGTWWNGEHVKIIYIILPSLNQKVARYGFAVSKKIAPKSVVRNRLKRQMREVVRLNRFSLEQKIAPFSIYSMVMSKKQKLDFHTVEGEWHTFVHQIKIPMKKKVVVLGKTGQLARCLNDLAPLYNDFLEITFFGRDTLDVRDNSHWEKFESDFENESFDVLVNCTAYTAVDKAEQETDIAMKINAEAVERMATFASKKNAEFIHVSTDYVFNGEKSSPYLPTDPIQPVSAYGSSKAIGEQRALESNPLSIVIRASWVFSEYGNNFVKTMFRLFKERASVGVVNDQTGKPTYAGDLAQAILKIILYPKKEYGIFHYANKEAVTWFEFASEILKLLKEKKIPLAINELKAITTADYPTPAKRPKNSVLDCKKIKKTYEIEIPSWKPALEKVLNKLIAENS